MSNIEITGAMPTRTEKLFKKISEFEEIKDWTLVGGTALSIHIKHRTSEDLDFFINTNKINRNLQRKIDSIKDELEKVGYVISDGNNMDEYQQDYSISGIKITFCTTYLMDLKKDIITYNNIDIANIDSIVAMKMHTLLKYRIKSRDFYDIKFLMEDQKYSFDMLLTSLKKHIPKYTATIQSIENRFLKAKLNSDDEGFESLELKKQETFKSLREYFEKVFQEKSETDIDIMNKVLHSNSTFLEKYNKTKFTFQNISLGMNLLAFGEIKKFKELKDYSFYNALETDFLDKTVFDYIVDLDNIKLFDEAMMTIKVIPDNLTERIAVLGDRDDYLHVINEHKIVNRCLDKNEATIDKVLESKIIYRDYIKKKILDKRIILKKRNLNS